MVTSLHLWTTIVESVTSLCKSCICATNFLFFFFDFPIYNFLSIIRWNHMTWIHRVTGNLTDYTPPLDFFFSNATFDYSWIVHVTNLALSEQIQYWQSQIFFGGCETELYNVVLHISWFVHHLKKLVGWPFLSENCEKLVFLINVYSLIKVVENLISDKYLRHSFCRFLH